MTGVSNIDKSTDCVQGNVLAQVRRLGPLSRQPLYTTPLPPTKNTTS